MTDEQVVQIATEADILSARQSGRAIAARLGFSQTDVTLIATAISELARNIVQYAGRGEIVLSVIEERSRAGLSIEARDRGPGIADVARALEDGFSTGGSLGLGLPGARRLLDELQVESEPGVGTVVRGTKWTSPSYVRT